MFYHMQVQSKTMNRDISTTRNFPLTVVDEWWLLLKRTVTYTARSGSWGVEGSNITF